MTTLSKTIALTVATVAATTLLSSKKVAEPIPRYLIQGTSPLRHGNYPVIHFTDGGFFQL